MGPRQSPDPLFFTDLCFAVLTTMPVDIAGTKPFILERRGERKQ